MMQLGIIGLPNAGKSTLFSALTGAEAEVGDYPFTTIDPNVGVAEVPDDRLRRLGEILNPRRLTPTVVEFADIAGLVEGASQGEGLGNQFLAKIREVRALVHVLRSFRDSEVSHVDGSLEPLRDAQTVDAELMLADLQTVERRLEEDAGKVKTGKPEDRQWVSFLRTLRERLAAGEGVRKLFKEADGAFDPSVSAKAEELHLLSTKPVLYVLNIDEEQYAEGRDPLSDDAVLEDCQRERIEDLVRYVRMRDGHILSISAQLEKELQGLSASERSLFLQEYGRQESALKRLVKGGYELLDLLTFFTFNDREGRARTLTRGQTALEAAGKVHSDIQQGFIKAEVVAADEVIEKGSYESARKAGAVSFQGKDYEVKDGDLIYFHFRG